MVGAADMGGPLDGDIVDQLVLEHNMMLRWLLFVEDLEAGAQ